jgi:tRNA A37 methylthiotransferase MiaB
VKKRLPASIIAADRTLMVTVQSLSDYAPRNAEFSIESIRKTEASLSQLEREERLAEERLAALREQVAAEGHRYHSKLLGVKDEVIAQYGSDSLAVKAIGRKRKSERKQPHRPVTAAPQL